MLITLFFHENLEIFIILVAIAVMFPCLRMMIFILILFLMYFYRVPERTISHDAQKTDLLAVSDGTIESIEYNPDNKTCRIIVFLGLMDQHQQYYPIDATVEQVVYRNGEFYPALFLEKSRYNERMDTILRPKSKPLSIIKITQIAGQIARRIVNHAFVGQSVCRGEWMGMIKLSSRVDVEFSINDYRPNVVIGEKIFAKETILAVSKEINK